MNGDTQIAAPDGNGNSKVFGVSVRAWIVLMFNFSVLGVWVANSIFASLGWTSSVNVKVEEPIYTIFVAVNTYYFTNIKK